MAKTAAGRAEQVVVKWTTDRFADKIDDVDCEELQELIAAAIKAAVAEERGRWRRWCIDFSEQRIPETLMEKAEAKPVSIRDAISLGWSAVLLALQAEVMREKRGDAP